MSRDQPEPFRVDGGRVPGDWIDYNGHMVDASYAAAFFNAAAHQAIPRPPQVGRTIELQ